MIIFNESEHLIFSFRAPLFCKTALDQLVTPKASTRKDLSWLANVKFVSKTPTSGTRFIWPVATSTASIALIRGSTPAPANFALSANVSLKSAAFARPNQSFQWCQSLALSPARHASTKPQQGLEPSQVIPIYGTEEKADPAVTSKNSAPYSIYIFNWPIHVLLKISFYIEP